MKEEIIQSLAFAVFVSDFTGDPITWSDADDLKYYHQKWTKEWLPEINAEHCGDCCNVPSSCIRCQLDEMFETAEILYKLTHK